MVNRIMKLMSLNNKQSKIKNKLTLINRSMKMLKKTIVSKLKRNMINQHQMFLQNLRLMIQMI